MAIKIPSRFLGQPIEGSMKRVLQSPASNPPTSPPPANRPPTPANIVGPEKYIILDGKNYGSYSYYDTLISTERTHLGKNWRDSQAGLASEGAFMLTVRQFADFLSLLKSGNAYDGTGRKIAKGKLTTLLKDIVEVRDPYRAEWLDADFKVVSGDLHINYEHQLVGGILKPTYSEPLESFLMEGKQPGIDLNDWISRATKQGLPPTDVKNGRLWYYSPMDDNKSVALFYAYSGGAGLGCGRDPAGTYPSLGVRAVRAKI